MEALYLVCGARRPQLKRDPLGSTTRNHMTQQPLEFVPTQHTDYLFPVSRAVLVLGLAFLAALAFWVYRRRRPRGPDS